MTASNLIQMFSFTHPYFALRQSVLVYHIELFVIFCMQTGGS